MAGAPDHGADLGVHNQFALENRGHEGLPAGVARGRFRQRTSRRIGRLDM